MICETNLIQKLWFINKPLAQHVSGTIMSIFRSARLYNIGYAFQLNNSLYTVHTTCLPASGEQQPLHCTHDLPPGFSRTTASTLCTRPASRLQPNNSLYTVHTTCLPASGEQQPLHCAHDLPPGFSRTTASTLYTRPASRLPKTPASTFKCWKPYVVIYGFALLKMGIMVPETCRVNGWLINHNCCIKSVSHIIS